MAYTILKARYFKNKICIMEKTELKSWCFTNDIDTLLYHMNNARYLRELDFARAEFYERTGLWASIKQAGGGVVQAATTVRYRRFIKPSTTFKITSKAVFWDEKTIFMDHEFISSDGFVNAVATCRQRVIGCGANTVVNLLHQVQCGGTCKAVAPVEMPPEIVAWVQANDISSAKLRKPKCDCEPDQCKCCFQITNTKLESTEKINGHVSSNSTRKEKEV
ncbi:protein THEM6-like isoform X1 [Arctopsyche grandis]|uniref:protein THEM6-like isoform X1 n=1 Tax=Arctopsyche grandis TaxID=121162 RepID=UPI00406DA2D0